MSLIRSALDAAFNGTLEAVHLARVITLLNSLTMGRQSTEVISYDLLYRVGKCYITKHCTTLAAVQAGADILYQFEVLNLLHMVDGGFVFDELDEIRGLWLELNNKVAGTRPRRMPQSVWTSNRHSDGSLLVSGEGKEYINNVAQPLVFQRVNTAQKVGWMVNETILEIATDEFEMKGEGFNDIWSISSKKAIESKIRETKTILRLAHDYKGNPFFHAYYLDFRGRIYPRTAYLNEQGCDLTRGLLLRADKKRIGELGFNWLFISLANSWAGSTEQSAQKTDKIPLGQRIAWARANEDAFLQYANAPKRYRDWTKAEKPWQFLAACNELKRIRNWEAAGNDVFDYSSGFEVSIDGTTNGSQHIAALLRDSQLAAQVNLLPAKYCGDLYAYVASNVWSLISSEYAKLSEEQIATAWENILACARLEAAVNTAIPEGKLALEQALRQMKTLLKPQQEQLSVVFWNAMSSAKERRKVVKRNVMTLCYGVTKYGMIAQQLGDARKHAIPLIKDLTRPYATYMGLAVYEHSGMRSSMELLETFREAGANSEYLAWKVPVTNFPVRQRYQSYKLGELNIIYGGTQLRVKVPLREICKPNKVKQASGAAPNIIHSLDAAHLIITAARCEKLGFTITTIHDCFGAHLCDMPILFKEVRNAFVDLYRDNPLPVILAAIGIDGIESAGLELGDLDIALVLDSEYAFS